MTGNTIEIPNTSGAQWRICVFRVRRVIKYRLEQIPLFRRQPRLQCPDKESRELKAPDPTMAQYLAPLHSVWHKEWSQLVDHPQPIAIISLFKDRFDLAKAFLRDLLASEIPHAHLIWVYDEDDPIANLLRRVPTPGHTKILVPVRANIGWEHIMNTAFTYAQRISRLRTLCICESDTRLHSQWFWTAVQCSHDASKAGRYVVAGSAISFGAAHTRHPDVECFDTRCGVACLRHTTNCNNLVFPYAIWHAALGPFRTRRMDWEWSDKIRAYRLSVAAPESSLCEHAGMGCSLVGHVDADRAAHSIWHKNQDMAEKAEASKEAYC